MLDVMDRPKAKIARATKRAAPQAGAGRKPSAPRAGVQVLPVEELSEADLLAIERSEIPADERWSLKDL